MISVLGIGDNVCDKYLHEAKMYPGGNALNVAVFSHMLGAESGYLGVFGDDVVGNHVYQTVKGLGVDLSHCRFEPGENGFARVLLVAGDRVFLKGNSGGVSRENPPRLTRLDLSYISEFDLVHTSVYSYLENQLAEIRGAARFISMDFSNVLDEKYFRQCCPYIDCAEISCGKMELSEIREVMKGILEAGCSKMVIATRGADGAALMTQEGFYEQSPNLVEAKDTMGAGDSFIASFLTSYLGGLRGGTDFKDGPGKGITKRSEYEDVLIRISLYRAAIFSAEQCQRAGSFGYGKSIELTAEDIKLMDAFRQH